MFPTNWKNELFTIPNLLSLFRLLLIPMYVSIYLRATEHRDFLTAGMILAVSCLTDAADGQIARRCNMVTALGKVLDPLADKLTQLVLVFCISSKYTVLRPVLWLLILKELSQTGLALLAFRRGKILSGALPAGKLCTGVLFVSLILLVLFPGLSPQAVSLIAFVDGAFLLTAFLCYLQAYLGGNAILKDI